MSNNTTRTMGEKSSTGASLVPTLVGFLSDEKEDVLSESWIDEDDLIPLPTSAQESSSNDVMACDYILFDLIPPTSDCESILQDHDDEPMLDCTSSEDEEYDISIDSTSFDEFEDILEFPSVTAAADDSVSRPLADRFEITIQSLRESMKRSGETRKSLTMKTCPSMIDTPGTVPSVIRRVEESTRFIQKSFYQANTKIVAV